MVNNTLATLNAAVNAKLVRLPALPGSARGNKPLVNCECGCKGLTQRRFVPGHDARLGGWVKRVERGIVTIEWIHENASYGEAAAVAKAMGLPMYPEGEKPEPKAKKAPRVRKPKVAKVTEPETVTAEVI